MSGISHGTKITPISYIFGDERKTLPIPDVDEDQVGGILSSMRASLVKDIVSKQKELHKMKSTLPKKPLKIYKITWENCQKCQKLEICIGGQLNTV